MSNAFFGMSHHFPYIRTFSDGSFMDDSWPWLMSHILRQKQKWWLIMMLRKVFPIGSRLISTPDWLQCSDCEWRCLSACNDTSVSTLITHWLLLISRETHTLTHCTPFVNYSGCAVRYCSLYFVMTVLSRTLCHYCVSFIMCCLIIATEHQ